MGIRRESSRLTVGADLVHGRTEARERPKYISVDFSRVRLAGDGVCEWETTELGDALVKGLNLGMVAIKKSQETTLSTGRTLHAPETQIVPCPLQVPQVPKQLLDPQCGALANRGELSRLKMGESEGWESAVGLGKGGETSDDGGQFGEEEV